MTYPLKHGMLSLEMRLSIMSHVPPQSSTTNPESKETSAKGGKIWEDPNMGLTRKYVPLNPLLHAHFPY